MKKIIIISGKQYSGKDTVAKILLQELGGFKRIGIGDAIKYEYGKKNNLTFEQIEAQKHLYRQDLIELGNWGRAQDPDYWLKKLIDFEGDIVIPDIRVPHEIELFKSYGAFSIRVDASREARVQRGKIVEENDQTETALDRYEAWDYVLDNSYDYETLICNVKPLVIKINQYFT